MEPPRRPAAPPSPVTADEQALAALRRSIDSLDAAVLALLVRRARRAAEVGKAKKGGGPWRPAREAAHLAHLAAAAGAEGSGTNALPPERVERLWRGIFNDSIASQRPLTLFATPEARPAARRHFGFSVRFHERPVPEACLDGLAAFARGGCPWRQGGVALFPARAWPALLARQEAAGGAKGGPDGGGGLAVLALLAWPGKGGGEGKVLVVSGAAGAEPSGQDVTFAAVPAASRKEALARLPSGLAADPENGGSAQLGGTAWQLLLLRGWHPAASLPRGARWLGAAPLPLHAALAVRAEGAGRGQGRGQRQRQGPQRSRGRGA